MYAPRCGLALDGLQPGEQVGAEQRQPPLMLLLSAPLGALALLLIHAEAQARQDKTEEGNLAAGARAAPATMRVYFAAFAAGRKFSRTEIPVQCARSNVRAESHGRCR